MTFKNLLEKHYTLLEQENPPQSQNAPETPQTPAESNMGEQGSTNQDGGKNIMTVEEMQELIKKSQGRVYDIINKIISYIREASSDTEKTKLSPELEEFIKKLEDATVKSVGDYTAKLDEIEQVVGSNLGKGLYEPSSETMGESFFQTWKNAK
jgi:hypothetical protein